jgi:ATP synthase I chain
VLGERTIRRVACLTPVFGITASLIASFLHRWDWAEGLILGAGLGWLNFHWLKRGVEAILSAAAAEAGVEKRRGTAAGYLAAAFRYALIGFSVYVIFKYLHVPLVSIVLGLCALAAAILVASVWEVLQSVP